MLSPGLDLELEEDAEEELPHLRERGRCFSSEDGFLIAWKISQIYLLFFQWPEFLSLDDSWPTEWGADQRRIRFQQRDDDGVRPAICCIAHTEMAAERRA